MSQNREPENKLTSGNREKSASGDDADRGADQPDSDTLFQSVRSFLMQEKETYGDFKVPELEDAGSGISQESSYKLDEETLNLDEPLAGYSSAAVSGSSAEKSLPEDGSSTGKEMLESGPAAAQTLEELLDICLSAEVLRTDLADTRLVFGTGNPDADLMLIGEAPGFQEDKEGEPFVGRAGQLLNKILEAISFRREDVYIANILKHRPPNNRDPLPEERDRSLPYLYRQIELVNPKLILCLGRISAQTLLKTTEPMKNLRGRFHPFSGGMELLVTFHPAALLRNPAWKRDTWEDVKLLRRRYDELTG